MKSTNGGWQRRAGGQLSLLQLHSKKSSQMQADVIEVNPITAVMVLHSAASVLQLL